MTTVGRFSPNKIREQVLNGTWAAEDDFSSGMGMVLIRPSSVSGSGSTFGARITTNGSVEVVNCTTFSMNGIFSSQYSNYILNTMFESDQDTWIAVKFRNSGNDDTTQSYVTQETLSVLSTLSARRGLSTDGRMFVSNTGALSFNGQICFIMGPYKTQPTVWRVTGTNYSSSVYTRVYDLTGTHDELASYDGITLTATVGGFSGLISVYGLVGA